MIFQALIKSDKVQLSDLPESGHIIGTALRLIDDGLYADAKLLILQSLPRQQRGTLHKPCQFYKKMKIFHLNRYIFHKSFILSFN